MSLYVMCLIIEDHTHHVCQKYHLTTARSTTIVLGVKIAERWMNIYNTLLVPAVLVARRGKAHSDVFFFTLPFLKLSTLTMLL